MATSVDFIALLQPTQCAISSNIFEYLHIYDRSMFAASCKHSLGAFIKYLESVAKPQQLSAKSFALRQFILRPGQDVFYPVTYLNELKKINAVLHPAASPEFVGKLRKAFYDEDKITLKILIDFGCDATKIMNDVLRKNLFCEPEILKIVLSSNKIDLNYPYYRGLYPIILAAIFLDKIEIWQVLSAKSYDNAINWDYADKKGRNLSYWACCCRTGNIVNFLKICLLKNVNMDNKDCNGNRAVSIAVCHRKMEVLQYLVDECKIDINEQNDTGITLGHDVCERAIPQMLSYLIPKGLKLDIKNNNGETAIDYARMYYSQDIIDVLTDNNLFHDS